MGNASLSYSRGDMLLRQHFHRSKTNKKCYLDTGLMALSKIQFESNGCLYDLPSYLGIIHLALTHLTKPAFRVTLAQSKKPSNQASWFSIWSAPQRDIFSLNLVLVWQEKGVCVEPDVHFNINLKLLFSLSAVFV